MAKAKIPAAPKALAQSLTMRPSLMVTEATPVYYINHAEINSSPFEIALTVGRLPTRPTAEQLEAVKESGMLEVEAELQLIFPPVLLVGLLRAINSQKEAHEAQFGQIQDPGAAE